VIEVVYGNGARRGGMPAWITQPGLMSDQLVGCSILIGSFQAGIELVRLASICAIARL
jgi:hypothetical protein